MNTLEYLKQRFEELKSESANGLGIVRQSAFNDFSAMGIPSAKHEEWKYTRIGGLFNKEYHLPSDKIVPGISIKNIDAFRLPGFETANELVFVNGIFSQELSVIRSEELNVFTLEEAAKNEHKETVSNNLG